MTLLLPATVNVHARVTDPEVLVAERTTLAALREQTDPPFCERLMVPMKPFTAVTVNVDAP